MRTVVEQHWDMIKAMGMSDYDKLVELIKKHLPASPDEYIRIYRIRYGIVARDREVRPLSKISNAV
jgi:hypothetical protein